MSLPGARWGPHPSELAETKGRVTGAPGAVGLPSLRSRAAAGPFQDGGGPKGREAPGLEEHLQHNTGKAGPSGEPRQRRWSRAWGDLCRRPGLSAVLPHQERGPAPAAMTRYRDRPGLQSPEHSSSAASNGRSASSHVCHVSVSTSPCPRSGPVGAERAPLWPPSHPGPSSCRGFWANPSSAGSAPAPFSARGLVEVCIQLSPLFLSLEEGTDPPWKRKSPW